MHVDVKKWAIFGFANFIVAMAIGFFAFLLIGSQLQTTPVSGLTTASMGVFVILKGILWSMLVWIIIGSTIYEWVFKKYPLILGLIGAASVWDVLWSILMSFNTLTFNGLLISLLWGAVSIYVTVWFLKLLKVKW